MNNYRNLLLSAWGLFLTSLILPAITVQGDSSYGFNAGAWAIFIIPSISDSFKEFQIAMMGVANIITLLCPLLLFKWHKFVYGLFCLFMSVAFILSVNLWFLGDNNVIEQHFIGYYVWVLSFLVLLIAIAYHLIQITKESQ